MLYQQPFDQPLVPNASYVDGNATNGTPGSIPRAAGIEFPQREIVNAQLAASLTPTNGDMTQLAQALSIGLWLGPMGGSANALADVLPTLATTSDGVTQYAIPALVVGMTFHGIVAATNTGPATLTLTGFGTAPGAKPIVRKDNTPLQAGDLLANAAVSFKWDGTSYRVVGVVPSDIGTYIANNYIIASPITIQVGGTVPAASTTGYPNYFATPAAALAWVSNYVISASGSVKFQFPAGQTTISSSLIISHPNGSQISFVGAAMKGANPTAASFQVSGSSASQRSADGAANLAMCRARFGSEILLTGGASIAYTANFGGFANVLITGDGTTTNGNGDVVQAYGGSSTFTNVVMNGGAGRGLVAAGSGTCVAAGCFTFGNGGNGFSAEEGGRIVMTNASSAFGNGANGGLVTSASLLAMDQTVPSSMTSRGNAQNGILATLGGAIPTLGGAAVFSNNAFSGVAATARGIVSVDASTAANNGQAGYTAQSGGYIDAVSTTGSGNGSYGYNASGAGLIVASGGNASGSSGTLTPAANTVGNGNAYIYQ